MFSKFFLGLYALFVYFQRTLLMLLPFISDRPVTNYYCSTLYLKHPQGSHFALRATYCLPILSNSILTVTKSKYACKHIF